MSNSKIPLRKDVPAKDKWDLSSIYKSDEEWEELSEVFDSFLLDAEEDSEEE